jgi:uncharacterized coiled-coil protein SlyX
MGKHDIRTVTSSEEHLMNRIKELEKRLAFANETNGKLKAEVSKYNKWMSEIEAAAQDRLAEKDEHIAQLEAKIVKLVTRYV